MGLEIGATTIRMTSRGPDAVGAVAVVRFFANLDELVERFQAPRAGEEAGCAPGAKEIPQCPGDAVVRTRRTRAGSFWVDYCLEWRGGAGAPDAAREMAIREALRRAGSSMVQEARKWSASSVAVPLFEPAARPEDDRRRFEAFCEGAVSALRIPGPAVERLYVCVGEDRRRARAFAEALKEACSAPGLAREVRPRPAKPPRPSEAAVPSSEPRGEVEDIGSANARSPAGADAWLTQHLPFPLAYPWHTVLRSVGPEQRIQRLKPALEAVFRTMTSFLLADYLAGPCDARALALVKALRKPTLGDLSKAVDGLAELLAARTAPSPFFAELGAWLNPSVGPSPRQLAVSLVGLRNAVAHGRLGGSAAATRSAAEQLEHHLREYLNTLRWLARYELLEVPTVEVLEDEILCGHWTVFRGKEREPWPHLERWRGLLPSKTCVLLDRPSGRALNLAPLVAVDHAGTEMVAVLEAIPNPNKVVLRAFGADASFERALVENGGPDAKKRFWSEANARRHAWVELVPTGAQ